MMTPERWRQIDGLFQSALERGGGERVAFLDEACAGDDGLRREVESLIAAHNQASGFIETPAIEVDARFIAGDADKIDKEDNANERRLTAGSIINHYRTGELLGAGGMGEVYLAVDTRVGRKVALKVLSHLFTADDGRVRRFQQEARAASALNHPNIITIHEVGQTDSLYFIVTELIEGETLRERLTKTKFDFKLKLHEALDISIQIASALAAAHEAGIVHRDIKPENIMIRPDGYVKVLDFGLAKLLRRRGEGETRRKGDDEPTLALSPHLPISPSPLLTEPDVVMGTVAYMSPEQASGQVVDARGDLWSLGVVLYEMVAGERPFDGKTPNHTIVSILEEEPRALSYRAPDVPEELERIVTKALTKDREERYQTAKDLLIDLRRLKKRLEVEAEIERTASPNKNALAQTESISAETTAAGDANRTVSSAEYIANEIKQHRRGFFGAALAMMLLAAIGFSYWFFSTRSTNTASATNIASIAVLPFVNESGNADVEYLSDGMTDLLINSLSQLPNLAVKARSSVFRYKGKDVELQTIADDLNVQAILNGRVIQRSDDLTLYLSLVDARTGNQLWGEQYNRKLIDIVSLQSEIARDVSSKLRQKLTGADKQKVAKNYTENAEAYQLYLQGLYHWNKLSPPEIRKSIAYFEQAVDVDPHYALAYADAGRGYFSLAMTADASSQEVFPKAREAAVKALEIDDTLAQAHTTLGWVKFWFDWDWNGAEQEFQRALSLNPNISDTYIAYAHVFTFTGRHAEALPLARRARELDPLNLRINALEGQALYYAGKYDDAIVRLQKTLELEPNFFIAHLFLARVYSEKKMYAEAIAEAIKARDFSSGQSESVAHLVYALAKSGRREEAQAALSELKKRPAEGRFVPPYCLALAYNGLGETDEAILSLEKGFLQQRDVRMTNLRVEPKWNNLRADPRFQDLLRRVGFPP